MVNDLHAMFLRTGERVEGLGLSHSAVDHGISWALYFDDPDGNGVEIYTDRRQAPGGTQLWQGRTRRLA